MKKILAILLILVLALTTMVGCDKIPGLDKIKLPWQKDEAPAAATLDDAKTYLYNTYKNSPEAPMADYDLVAKVIIKEVTFNVTWTASLDSITIKESRNANFWTVDLPDKNETKVAYVLTATIADADGNTVEVKFDRTLPVIDSTGVETLLSEGVAYKMYFEQVNLGYTLFATNTTQNNQNKFIEATLDPKEAADFYVEIVGDGYKIYTEIDGVKHYLHATATLKETGNGYTKTIGFATETECVFNYDADLRTFLVVLNNEKFGVGTYNAFETISISELKYFKTDNINVEGGQFPIGFMTSEHAETLTPDEKPVAKDPAADSTLTIAEALALGNTKVKDQYTEGKYYVTGTVKEIQNETYGNLVITDGTNDLLVYGTYDATGANRFDAMEAKPVVGDTITVYGVIGMYNAAQMKNGWITSINGSGSNVPPVETGDLTVVDAPVAGVAYKLGLFHGNENADVFFNGKEYSSAQPWYLGYGAAATAVDVYLEAVEGVDGAFRLYFYNGDAKTYIRMYPRDGDATKGTMEMTTSVPAEYYTYNTEYKTLIYTNPDNNAQFYMGSSGTYKSISTSAISYITSETSYIAHFYAEQVAHTCEFVAGETVLPTCTEAGYTVYTCAGCGKTENRDEVAATGHVNTTTTTVDATCTVDGSETVTCACGEVVSTTTLPATGHDFSNGDECANGCGTTKEHVCEFVASDKVVAPTCTEAGYTVYTCTCGLTENRDHVDALGHDYDASVTAPTCTEPGYTTYTCGVCDNDTYTEEGEPATGHAYDSGKVVDPTCTAAGYTAYTCGNCGDVREEPGEAATGHSYTEGVCSGCGQDDPDHYFEMTVAEALEAPVGKKVKLTGTVSEFYQTWNSQYNNVSPYITDESGARIIIFRTTVNVGIGDLVTVTGVIGQYNSVNQIAQGNTLVVDVPHACEYDADVTAPTCVSAGFTTYTCPVCANSYTEEGEPATGHTYENGTCTACGHAEGGNEVVVTTASKTIAALISELGWTNTTTKQSFKLDDNVTVKINGGSNTGKAYNGDHIRIYATDTPAGTITISVPEGYELVSVKITTQTGTYAFLYVDGTTTDICNKTVEVSGSSVVLNSVKNGSDGKQVRVTAIEVVYQTVG